MPSTIRVLPFSRQNFKNQSLNLGLFKFVTDRPFYISSAYFLVIQDWPWPWGSISSGYLSEFVTMIAFWTDKVSFGNPWRFHYPTVASSTKKFVNSYASEGKFGIYFYFISAVNFWTARISLNSALKGPQ